MAIEGPAEKETVTCQGHAYGYRLQGRMDDRSVCLQVGTGCYKVGAAPGGGLAIKGLPAAPPLPPVLAKGSYVESQTRSQPFVDVLYLALPLPIMGVRFPNTTLSS